MSSILIKNEQGLALMGSILLVSMLAVMSTTFLLIMAADVRIAQSHYRSTQAYYLAVSAAEIAELEISNDPSLALDAAETDIIIQRSIGEGEFYVFSYDVNPPEDNKRELRISAKSGRAWYDMYIEAMIPSQDPRTFYPIVSWNKLKLQAGCQVIGGEGVWSIGYDPEVHKDFQLDSPSIGNGFLYTSSSASWGAGPGNVDPGVTGLNIYTNYPSIYPSIYTADNPSPAVDTYFPRILQDDTSGLLNYYYYVTGDSIKHKAWKLTSEDVTGGIHSPGINNPMKLYVWDFNEDGTFSGNFIIDGTLVCIGDGKVIFNNGNITISPLTTLTSPQEYYPAIIAKGEIQIRGSGARIFNGLVYSQKKLSSAPDSLTGKFYVRGAVIARDIDLKVNTIIAYSDSLQTMPAAAFKPNDSLKYPTLNLHRRRYIDTPPLPP